MDLTKFTSNKKILSVCLSWRLLRCVSVSTFSLFFFFFFFTCFPPHKRLLFMYCTWTVTATFDQFYVNSASMHCSRSHKFHFLSIFFIKNGSHGTIYTFKNYFATVISAINFQFQQNKSYPNRPYVKLYPSVINKFIAKLFSKI